MQITGIEFTEREADIIACILHLKGSKKIAQILNISPRTIEGYIQNILHKIGVNSQENVREKIEESSEVHFVKRRYIQLQIKSLFFEKLNPSWNVSEVKCRYLEDSSDLKNYMR